MPSNDRDATGWPLVVPDDNGIRPAGTPGECFYCGQNVGQPHARDCVCVEKTVRLRYTFEVTVKVPHSWTKEDVELYRNDSSWSPSNAIIELGNSDDYTLDTEYLHDVDVTPQRDRHKHHGVRLGPTVCTCTHHVSAHHPGGCYNCAPCTGFSAHA